MSTPPIEPDEVMYRQVGSGGNPIYYDPNRPVPLFQAVFLPGRKDSDGLSLLRSQFRSRVWSAHRTESPDKQYRLACFRAEDAIRIAGQHGIDAFSFRVSPDELDQRNGEPWAHSVAEQINRTSYDNDRAAQICIKEWALAMANHVVQENIIGPFPKPTDADPYRPESFSDPS